MHVEENPVLVDLDVHARERGHAHGASGYEHDRHHAGGHEHGHAVAEGDVGPAEAPVRSRKQVGAQRPAGPDEDPRDPAPVSAERDRVRRSRGDPAEPAARAGAAVIGLPDGVRGCLFDLDGVLTRTAKVHAAAWKEMFDGYLHERAARTGKKFRPFDPSADYAHYVDGKPRYDGVRSFLAARGIELPEGEPGDPPGAETVRGLGNRKNEIVVRMIREGGVEAYEGSVRYLEAAREAGLRRAVVSSSANTREVLVAAGIEGFFEARVDGVVAEREGLKGKPAPDTFLAGARALGVASEEAAVFEDALAGVAAGRAGGFACVVGVDRAGQAGALREHGASIVVSDLSELLEDR
jgi:beta-phosphoglucomutase family hydrolase